MRFFLFVVLLAICLASLGQGASIRVPRQEPIVENAQVENVPVEATVLTEQVPVEPEVTEQVPVEPEVTEQVPVEPESTFVEPTVVEVLPEATTIVNKVVPVTEVHEEIIEKVVPTTEIREEVIRHVEPVIETRQEVITHPEVLTTMVPETFERIRVYTERVPETIVHPEPVTMMVPQTINHINVATENYEETFTVPEVVTQMVPRSVMKSRVVTQIVPEVVTHPELMTTLVPEIIERKELATTIEPQVVAVAETEQPQVVETRTEVVDPTYVPPVQLPIAHVPLVAPAAPVAAVNLEEIQAKIKLQIATAQANARAAHEKALADVARLQAEHRRRLAELGIAVPEPVVVQPAVAVPDPTLIEPVVAVESGVPLVVTPPVVDYQAQIQAQIAAAQENAKTLQAKALADIQAAQLRHQEYLASIGLAPNCPPSVHAPGVPPQNPAILNNPPQLVAAPLATTQLPLAQTFIAPTAENVLSRLRRQLDEQQQTLKLKQQENIAKIKEQQEKTKQEVARLQAEQKARLDKLTNPATVQPTLIAPAVTTPLPTLSFAEQVKLNEAKLKAQIAKAQEDARLALAKFTLAPLQPNPTVVGAPLIKTTAIPTLVKA